MKSSRRLPPHRWSVLNNYLCGVTAEDWRRLLRETGNDPDAVYWHRAAFVTGASLMNSWYARREQARWGDRIRNAGMPAAPLFVLGHWRSGTTLLQNLLAEDPRLASPNTYQVLNPRTFLSTESVHARRFRRLLPERRLMDNMALGFQSPQEEEFAPCLTSLRSLYLGMSFPRRASHYETFMTFRDASDADRRAWVGEWVRFLKKIHLKVGGRTLVLKSPPHTARIRMILEVFPDARFVHIHRHPAAVFQSFLHYHDTALCYTYLQRPDLQSVPDQIIARYNRMHDAFFSEVGQIPSGRFCEVRFGDLESDPVGTVRGIYEALSLPAFDAVESRLRAYVATLAGYRRNRFQPLPEAMRRRLGVEWRRTFDTWKYSETESE